MLPGLTWFILDDMDEQRNIDEEATSNTDWDSARKWKEALSKVADLAGYHLEEGEPESNFIQRIVKMVKKRLNHKPLHVAQYPVGLASRIKNVIQKVNMEPNDEVRMVGLHGMIGIGKRTFAKALYNKYASEFEFDGCCFLSKVGERSKTQGLGQLQQTLLSTIAGDHDRHLMEYSGEGTDVERMLRSKKVLIVIDAVDQPEQLEKLAGGLDWFGKGSIIIITTQDLHLLMLKKDQIKVIHEIKELEDSEATQLFSWYAFGNPQPDESLMELSTRAIRYAQGLPFALQVLGSSLRPKSPSEWDEVLKHFERDPNNRINNILKISYKSLTNEEKTIFVDMALFLRGKPIDAVIKFLDGCGFNSHYYIKRLTEKSLVYVDYKGTLEMHGLQEVMGNTIANESSALCIREKQDISRLFSKDKSLYAVEILSLDLCGEDAVALNLLEDLRKLRLLEIRNGGGFTKMPKSLPSSIRWLDWPECPLKSIGIGFLPANLVFLEMPSSTIKKFTAVKQRIHFFRNPSGCVYLREIIDFLAVPNLQELDLRGCKALKKLSDSFGELVKLEKVDLDGCSSLTRIPNLEGNLRLKSINLNGCSNLQSLPNLPTSLTSLSLSMSGIEELPSSIGNCKELSEVTASNCKNLASVSYEIYKLPCIKCLDLSNCPKLLVLKLPELETERSTEPEADRSTVSSTAASRVDYWLNLSENQFVTLPENTFKFIQIKYLVLNNCQRLDEIPELPHCLLSLEARKCRSLRRFSRVQSEIFDGNFTNCHKLAKNEKQSWTVMFQNLSRTYLEDNLRREYRIILPGNEIPEWFGRHFKCEGNKPCFKLQAWELNDLIGFAWCAVFQCPESYGSRFSIKFSMSDFVVQSELITPLESDHMLLSFCTGFQLPKLSHAEEISCELHCHGDALAFKKLGLHFVYKS